jgi:hypothetical protein
MSVKLLVNQIELSFWYFAIPFMQNSTLIQSLAPKIYSLYLAITIKKQKMQRKFTALKSYLRNKIILQGYPKKT